MANITKLSTKVLEDMLAELETYGDESDLVALATEAEAIELIEQIEAELDRRDYDASDPWSPENTH